MRKNRRWTSIVVLMATMMSFTSCLPDVGPERVTIVTIDDIFKKSYKIPNSYFSSLGRMAAIDKTRPFVHLEIDLRNGKGWCRVVGGNSLAALSEQVIVGLVRRRGQGWLVGLAEPRSPIH